MSTKNELIHQTIEKNKRVFTTLRRSDIALQFRQCMVAKGVKSIDLAERLGVSEPNISRWLRGDQNLKIDTLYLIADALEERLTLSIDVAEHGLSVDGNCEDQKEWSRVDVTSIANVIPIENYRHKIVMNRNVAFKAAKSHATIVLNGEKNERAKTAA